MKINLGVTAAEITGLAVLIGGWNIVAAPNLIVFQGFAHGHEKEAETVPSLAVYWTL